MKFLLTKTLLGSVGIILLCNGCQLTTTPDPLPDTNAAALAEPISYYGDVRLISEKKDPLRVKVISAATSEETAVSEQMQLLLKKADIQPSIGNEPFDMQIYVNASSKILTAAPACRISGAMRITATSTEGVSLLKNWNHKIENHQTFATEQAARNALTRQMISDLNIWCDEVFMYQAMPLLDISIMRFALSRSLIEIGTQVNVETRELLNRLRALSGVMDVRLIDVNRKDRIASFRVLFRKDIYPNGLAPVIKK